MHRFRRKSDARRSELPSSSPNHGVASSSHPHPPFPVVTRHVQVHPPPDPLSLPPVSDFRTSLILPELSRRFTLLRKSSGTPYSLADLRSRFAEQRAKGVENHISEEEEDMLLDMLSRIRSHGAALGGAHPKIFPAEESAESTARSEPSLASISSNDAGSSTSSTVRQSTQSSATMSSNSSSAYVPSHSPVSPSMRSSKRHSNNMFAAGHFRDVRYMRKSSNRTISSSRSALSSTQSESTTENVANALIDSYSEAEGVMRPMTPDNTTPTVSPSTSPVSPAPNRSINLSSSSSVEDSLGPLPGPSTLRIGRQLTGNQIQRMSMSLEEAIKKIEEEADDQVLVPRSAASMQQNGSSAAVEGDRAYALTTDDNNQSSSKAITETSNESSTMSWVADADNSSPVGAYRSPSPYRAGRSTSPVPRVPGYIPGMPRPVTPHRDMDMEDVRSLSTTPRAASSATYDRSATSGSPFSNSTSSPLLRQIVNSSPTPYGARPKSPHSSVKDRHGSSLNGTEYTSLGSHWRRPSSPLSSNSNAFQSLNSGSRPSTPSNVTWNVSSRESGQGSRSLGRSGTLLGHSSSASNSSISEGQWTDTSNDNAGKNVLRSPRPVYSPMTPENSGAADVHNKFLSNGSTLSTSVLALVDYDASLELPSRRGVTSSPGLDYGRSVSVTSTADNGAGGKHRVVSPLLTPPTSPFAQRFQTNPLAISHLSNNSSRSSLESIGSSYHSREEDDGVEFTYVPERAEPAWHESPLPANVSSQNRLGARADDPEYILRQYTGLSKLDLVTIQGKLIDTAHARAKNSEFRSPSTLRRRRPSTAQSIHSAGGQPSRTTSPVPVYGLPWPSTVESGATANALLTSVMDSIGQLRPAEHDRNESDDTEVPMGPPPPTLAPIPTSSPGRRNKDLAEILFGGSSDAEPVPSLPEPEPVTESQPEPEHALHNAHGQGDQHAEETRQKVESPRQSPVPSKAEETTVSQSTFEHSRDTSERRAAAGDSTDLIRQVQERTEAAMAQLRRSPQQGRFPVSGPHVARKKIQLQDISGPLLVQSSTSIDKIPTVPTSPQRPTQNEMSRTVKMSLSKRLRNTLRSKNPQLSGDEVTPWTLDNPSSSLTNSPLVGNRSLTPSKSSMTDLNAQPKAPNVSPPASAGPNLKTFMSRFRKKGQPGGYTDTEHKAGAASITLLNTPPVSAPPNRRRSFQLAPSSVSLLSRSGSVSHTNARDVPTAPSMSRQTTETATVVGSSSLSSSLPSEPAALKQFYEAAQSLGLDQSALNEFLARSNSTVSQRPGPSALEHDGASTEKPYADHPPRASSPVIPEVIIDRPGADQRYTPFRQHAGSPVPAAPRRVREIADAHGSVRNTIVRRTLIFPSASGSTTDLTSLSRKPTTKSYKRASNMSVQSNRSVHERIPTPPPSKAKRQSFDPSPPVPGLPSPLSFSNPGRFSSSRLTPDTPLEKSPYESFYDMYAGDRSGSAQSPEPFEPPKTPLDEGLPEVEEGQALEVIELANGETIWSIVNGLRAEDAESFYPRRGSVDSDYSSLPAHDSESEQLFFKEHTRTGSKGSNISTYTRRKSHLAARPETKVFHSSSARIARLIEQLAHNTEAATFNIKPKTSSHVPGHSHSGSLQTESDVNWTVEERLEHMLDSVKASG